MMVRGIGLRGAIALNVITMIGIGPLITIPLVLAQLAGPLALAGWIAGAIVALCDGLVWAELGSRYPGSGGTYVYLREIFGPERLGRMLAFLFNWQFLLYAPFLLASGYIGFAGYASFLWPQAATTWWAHDATAIGVGVLTIVLLYRRVSAVAAMGIAFAMVAVGTLVIIIAAAFGHAAAAHSFSLHGSAALGTGFLAGLGGALFVTLYDYVGYNDAALLGDEVRIPTRTVPAAIVCSILLVAVLYVLLQIGVLSALPWLTLVRNGSPTAQSQFVASSVVALSWGTWPARVVTVLILVTALASVYGNLAGFARIPYAAAKDGAFFRAFAHLHPRGRFPDVALLFIGIASLAACFFTLDQAIAILTAGIVLIQSVAQIIALFVLRARNDRAPFRMWLFPLPALVALAGWLYAFAYTGTTAITLGLAWLAAGAAVYLAGAKKQRFWPFALALTMLCGSLMGYARAAPVFAVGGRPFFVYAASFFYERIPRDRWGASLDRYQALGINTIDLYVPWNWHEPSEGRFDFTGATNPRRDLTGLFAMIHKRGFKIILRPGPVIRNEWRNGGYPAWLLTRPAYRMPLSDVLEGRYPATATLQNTHSDDAAAEWLHNATHMRYTAIWLRTVLRTIAPWRRDVIAIALDDDQGAYIDNQTWPAPHFHAYLNALASIVRSAARSGVPLFINTYQMKVTASAPVWAWGNWYQSDAYSIGEHDRAQLEFSTGLLQTQRRRPVMISEFQAGWLQGADEAFPRPADPTNTTLALHTMLQFGSHGFVNFPVQDTRDPAGWEAPWANERYDWDAALGTRLQAQARWKPTARFGALVRAYGTQLAQTQPAEDAAIAYLASAYHSHDLSKGLIMRIADATIRAQKGCRIVRISCGLVDLRYASAATLHRFPILIVPANGIALPYVRSVLRALAAYRAAGGHIEPGPRSARVAHPVAGGIPNAALLVFAAQRYAFLDVVNYSHSLLRTQAAVVHDGSFSARIPSLTVQARDALLLPLHLAPVRIAIPSPSPPLRSFPAHARSKAVYRSDFFNDGYPAVVFDNGAARLIVSPCAGARAFIFQDDKSGARNAFSTVGALRDAWSPQLAASARDYIAAYTHPIAAGTFNRCYAVRVAGRIADFSYFAPDAPLGGATIVKSITIDPVKPEFEVSTGISFVQAHGESPQQLSSFALAAGARIFHDGAAYAVYDPRQGSALLYSWKAPGAHGALFLRRGNAVVSVTWAANAQLRARYGIVRAASARQAMTALRQFRRRR